MGTIHYNAQPGTSDTAVYTNGGSTAVPLTKIVAVNATGGAATLNLTVHRSLSGNVELTTPSAGVSIPAGSAASLVEDRLLALEEIVLDPGDSLHAWASAAATITVVAFE